VEVDYNFCIEGGWGSEFYIYLFKGAKMAKFAWVCSLTFVVVLVLGGCAISHSAGPTSHSGRYDWLNLDKYKKPAERKKVAAKQPRRYEWRKPEKKEEVTEEAGREEPPRPEQKRVVAEKPGRYDWLRTRPEEKEEVEVVEEEVDREPLGKKGDLDLKFDYWMTGGEQVWSAAHYGWKVSELVYPADTNFWVFTGEYRFADRWSVDASYGFGDCDKKTGSDSDWVTPGDPRRSHLSIFDTTGDASFWMVDLYYRFWTDNRSFLDAFLGYQRNENSFKMTNGQWVIYDYLPDSTPIFGLNSTYEIDYQGVRVGVRGETPLTRNPEWTLEGSVAYLPKVEAEAKGYWNLRDMRFRQSGGDGDGIDAYVAVNYRPHNNPNFTLELGYRYMELETSGGISRSDEMGYIWYADWHKTRCKFDGIFFGLGYIF